MHKIVFNQHLVLVAITMGAGQSKDETLYNAVRNGNCDAVKALQLEGASLEWVDKRGRTPLILACMRSGLLEMAETLLHLGANSKAYRPGICGGFPLHHAAKRGLEKTVSLLLSHGADPLAVNDDGQTPLDMARSRGHVTVVRMLEEQLCLFSGIFRELSGPRVFETYIPKLVTNKVWAVVLLSESNPGRATKYELAIYQAPMVSLWSGVHPSSHPAGLCNVARPRKIISLAQAVIEPPKFNSADPVLYIIDKGSNTKYKLLSENEGDKAQLQRLYRACKGASQAPGTNDLSLPRLTYPQGNPSEEHPHAIGILSPDRPPGPNTTLLALPAPEASLPEDVALALALDLSIRSATQQGICVSPNGSSRANSHGSSRTTSYGSDSVGGSHPRKPRKISNHRDEKISANNGGGEEEASSSSSKDYPSNKPSSHYTPQLVSAEGNPPDAVRYPAIEDSPISYPSVESVELSISKPDLSLSERGKMDEMSGRLCVVCWDTRVEGLCVPCGHLAGCMSCLTEIEGKKWGCPVCRTQIQQIVKVYSV